MALARGGWRWPGGRWPGPAPQEPGGYRTYRPARSPSGTVATGSQLNR
jgi:hypothetical protein